MAALKMANPNELSSLEIKLLHALKDGPIGITQICKKLQVVSEHAEKLTKNLVTKRFITKQSNSQYRNLIKTAEIPALIKSAEMPAEPAPMAEFKPEPAASCTYPICTCEKDKCEEDPLVDTNFAGININSEGRQHERSLFYYKADRPEVVKRASITFNPAELQHINAAFDAAKKAMLNVGKCASEDIDIGIYAFAAKNTHERIKNFIKDTPLMKNPFAKPFPLSQVGVTFSEEQAAKVRKLIAIDKANALRDTAFAEIDPIAIENAMERRKNSPLADDLLQELYLITERLAAKPKQSPPPLLNIDKKLSLISYMRLLLEKLPNTSRLLDEIEADYMELKRQQEKSC